MHTTEKKICFSHFPETVKKWQGEKNTQKMRLFPGDLQLAEVCIFHFQEFATSLTLPPSAPSALLAFLHTVLLPASASQGRSSSICLRGEMKGDQIPQIVSKR